MTGKEPNRRRREVGWTQNRRSNMTGAITKMSILLLVVAVWAFTPIGYSYANSLQGGQVQVTADRYVTTEVEIQRKDSFPTHRSRMLELCNRLEADSALSDDDGRTNVEIYRRETGPGMTEYRREYRQSSRFSVPAGDERTLEFCRRLENPAPADGPANSEVHIYRETVVPR
jgi:hypothetical protein